MCGRYYAPTVAEIERLWDIGRHNWQGWIVPHFNVAPTTQVPIIVQGADGVLELAGARWGLIPGWWNKPTPPSLTFNARSEEAAAKPTWRDSLRSRRCLMPASGWYEWNESEKVRNDAGRLVNQPYCIRRPNAEVIAFAGLWASWQGPSGPILSCALLSKEAASSIAEIHHRMPVVLKPEQYGAWLGGDTSAAQVQDLIAHPCEDFEGYPVSTRVNSARNDGPELLENIRS